MRFNKKDLSFLAKYYPGNNPISLLSGMNLPLLGDEEKELEGKGVLIDGSLTPEGKKLVDIVASPQRCTRLVLKDGSYYIEKYSYKLNDEYALVENEDGEIILSSIEKIDDAIFQLSRWTGISDLKSFDLNVTLQNNELLLFLAIVDIKRINTLLSYLGKKDLREISKDQLQKQLANPEKGGLTSILTGNYQFIVPEEKDIPSILEGLVNKGVLFYKSEYSLLGQYEEFAKNFLIPQTVVMLETFNLLNNNEIAGAGILTIGAGMREIITIIFKEGNVEVASLSGRQHLKMIEDFLYCPEIKLW